MMNIGRRTGKSEAAEPVRDGLAAEVERVVEWRRTELERAGLPYPIALELAITRSVDLHSVLTAVKRGADPELIVRIFL